VRTPEGTYTCRKLLITAGIWTKEIANWLGIALPINLRINQMIVTPRLPHFIHHMITHAAGNLTLKQVECGSVLVGGGWPGDGDLARNVKMPRYLSVVGNALAAVRVVPGLADVEAIRTWAGFDGRTEDQLPILGALPGYDNVFVASSCFGGYVAGPFIGKLMAQVMSGRVPEMSLDAFSPRRYACVESNGKGGSTC
jgi:sarcosine oxidase subunit beta